MVKLQELKERERMMRGMMGGEGCVFFNEGEDDDEEEDGEGQERRRRSEGGES